MRHQTKKHTLSKAQDQRKALLRSLATELFVHGEITTTLARAKALKPYAEKVITMAKKGDLNSIRNAARYISTRKKQCSPSPETYSARWTRARSPKSSLLGI